MSIEAVIKVWMPKNDELLNVGSDNLYTNNDKESKDSVINIWCSKKRRSINLSLCSDLQLLSLVLFQ